MLFTSKVSNISRRRSNRNRKQEYYWRKSCNY